MSNASHTTTGVAAAILFRAKNEEGKLFSEDQKFAEKIYPQGIDYVLKNICNLDLKQEQEITSKIKEIYNKIVTKPENWIKLTI